MRVYAHTTDPEHPFMVSSKISNQSGTCQLFPCARLLLNLIPVMQVQPGEYNTDALEAMDYVLEAARKAGMKVMLSFADNWKLRGECLAAYHAIAA